MGFCAGRTVGLLKVSNKEQTIEKVKLTTYNWWFATQRCTGPMRAWILPLTCLGTFVGQLECPLHMVSN